MEEMVVCPTCGSKVIKCKYCSECGSDLTNDNGIRIIKKPIIKPSLIKPIEVTKKAQSDEGLKVIVDCICYTVATVNGDGYTESVLYYDETNKQYSIHTYRQYQPNNVLSHQSYLTNEEFKNQLLQYIKKENIKAYKDAHGSGLCGARYVCKYLDGNEMIRISTDNMPSNGYSILSSIHSFLNSGIHKEDETFALDD